MNPLNFGFPDKAKPQIYFGRGSEKAATLMGEPGVKK